MPPHFGLQDLRQAPSHGVKNRRGSDLPVSHSSTWSGPGHRRTSNTCRPSRRRLCADPVPLNAGVDGTCAEDVTEIRETRRQTYLSLNPNATIRCLNHAHIVSSVTWEA